MFRKKIHAQRACGTLALRGVSQAAQEGIGINARAVPVSPCGLNSVAANRLPRREIEAALGVGNRWLDDASHYVRLAVAYGARAVPPQEFQSEIALAAVAPRDGEFVADFLDCCGLQGGSHKMLVGLSLIHI